MDRPGRHVVCAVPEEPGVLRLPSLTSRQCGDFASRVRADRRAEPLTVVSLAREVSSVREALVSGGTVVAYKGGCGLGEPRTAIAESGALERPVYAEHLGTSMHGYFRCPR